MTVRDERLARIAAAHDAWQTAHLADAPRRPRGRKVAEGSDYPEHHLTVDPDPGQSDDLVARIASL